MFVVVLIVETFVLKNLNLKIISFKIMSTSIIEHQEELLIKEKTEEAISCFNTSLKNKKNEEINALNNYQISLADSTTDTTKNSNNVNKNVLTVNDWDYNEFGPCGPNQWLKILTEFENKIALDSTHNLASKLPPNCCTERESSKGAENFTSSFVRYQGSLTTPPCTENVTWTVFTDPVSITKEQLSYLRNIKDCKGKLITKNYRPVQKIVDHKICLHLAS
ncbi:Alpha-carbonic anhydrase domain-containing protein [Meloidogyne graminicola]|uniref:carbonic anhydrase n=1 Tax=Meloidogyne graminicola TaxID=189291 RepID=A0A8S9ZLF0_9BILA|nr:Alpha-carbonic anhydrase domain-containing protein [Meloidogyne graminicola]